MDENRIISKDFLIPDVENKDDYKTYKVELFRTVPANTALICKNTFTGAVSSRSKGLTFIFPWISSKFVSLASKTIDYPKEIYKTMDGIEVAVDFALTVKVSDPVDFEVESQNPLQEVGIVAMDLMRAYVATVNAEELYRSTVNISDVDPANELEDVADAIGIKVTNIYVKNIELPKSMKDDFEKLVTATKERDIAQIKAETLRTQAQAEADSDKIRSNAVLEVELIKMREIIKILTDKGYSSEQVIEFLRTSQFANGTASVIANIDGKTDSSSLSAAQMVAGMLGNNNNNNMNNNSNPTLSQNVRVRRK